MEKTMTRMNIYRDEMPCVSHYLCLDADDRLQCTCMIKMTFCCTSATYCSLPKCCTTASIQALSHPNLLVCISNGHLALSLSMHQ